MEEATPGHALVVWAAAPSTKRKKRSELDGLLPFCWDTKGAPVGAAMLRQYGERQEVRLWPGCAPEVFGAHRASPQASPGELLRTSDEPARTRTRRLTEVRAATSSGPRQSLLSRCVSQIQTKSSALLTPRPADAAFVRHSCYCARVRGRHRGCEKAVARGDAPATVSAHARGAASRAPPSCRAGGRR